MSAPEPGKYLASRHFSMRLSLWIAEAAIVLVIVTLGRRGPSSAEVTATLAAPTIEILSAGRTVDDHQQFVALSCRAANPTKTSMWFYGYLPESFDPPLEKGIMWPSCVMQFRQAGRWQIHPLIGQCGVGLGMVELAPGESGSFGCELPIEATWTAIRVGISWAGSPEPTDKLSEAWSQSLKLDLIAGKSGEFHRN